MTAIPQDPPTALERLRGLVTQEPDPDRRAKQEALARQMQAANPFAPILRPGAPGLPPITVPEQEEGFFGELARGIGELPGQLKNLAAVRAITGEPAAVAGAGVKRGSEAALDVMFDWTRTLAGWAGIDLDEEETGRVFLEKLAEPFRDPAGWWGKDSDTLMREAQQRAQAYSQAEEGFLAERPVAKGAVEVVGAVGGIGGAMMGPFGFAGKVTRAVQAQAATMLPKITAKLAKSEKAKASFEAMARVALGPASGAAGFTALHAVEQRDLIEGALLGGAFHYIGLLGSRVEQAMGGGLVGRAAAGVTEGPLIHLTGAVPNIEGDPSFLALVDAVISGDMDAIEDATAGMWQTTAGFGIFKAMMPAAAQRHRQTVPISRKAIESRMVEELTREAYDRLPIELRDAAETVRQWLESKSVARTMTPEQIATGMKAVELSLRGDVTGETIATVLSPDFQRAMRQAGNDPIQVRKIIEQLAGTASGAITAEEAIRAVSQEELDVAKRDKSSQVRAEGEAQEVGEKPLRGVSEGDRTKLQDREEVARQEEALAKVGSQIIRPGEEPGAFYNSIKRTLNNWFSRQAWVTDMAVVERAEKAALKEVGKTREELELLPSEQPTMMFPFIRGESGAMVDDFLIKSTNSLRAIAQPLRKEQKNALAFTYAKRALAVLEQGKNPGISREDAQAVLDRFKGRKDFEDFSQGLTEYADRLLQYLEDAGVFTPEHIQTIRASRGELHPVYAPLRRFFDEGEFVAGGEGTGPGKIAGKAAPKPVKSLKGSRRAIVDPIMALVTQTRSMIQAANKVRAAQSMAKFEEAVGGGFLAQKVTPPKDVTQFMVERVSSQLEEMGMSVPKDMREEYLTLISTEAFAKSNRPMVVIVRDGKREFWEITDPEVYELVTGFNQPVGGSIWETIAAPFTEAVRMGAVGLSLPFAVANVLRDIRVAAIQSSHGRGLTPVAAEFVKGLFGGKTLHEAEKIGGFSHTFMGQLRKTNDWSLREQVAPRPVGEFMKAGMKNPLLFFWQGRRSLDWLQKTIGKMEELPRLAEFKAALAEGRKKYGNNEEALIYAQRAEADATVDFLRAGVKARILNYHIPFFNARVQGISKFIRTWHERPLQALAKSIAYITIPELALWWMNKDEVWWQEQSEYDRRHYMMFSWDGGENILRIPRPFEWGQLFGTAPVEAAQALYEQDPDQLREEMWEVLKTFNPATELIPSWVKPFVEAGTGYDLWRKRPIVPEYREKSEPDWKLFYDWNTEFSKWLGRALDVSPAKIDQFMGSVSGGLLPELTRSVEKVIGVAQERPDEDLPGIRRFLQTFHPQRARSATKVYDERTRLEKKAGGDEELTESEAWFLGRVDAQTRRWSALRDRGERDPEELEDVRQLIFEQARDFWQQYRREQRRDR